MSILDQLEEREREIILHRYGLEQGSEPLTLEQVGQRFGVTKERIRQIESRRLAEAPQDRDGGEAGHPRRLTERMANTVR